MAWRRGEEWLDTDLFWFRDGAGAPAAAVALPPLRGFTPSPGLAASRLRRVTLEQRRSMRRARVTALAISPAVVLALAGLRSGDPGKALAEDPPSVTLRLGSERSGIAAVALGSGGALDTGSARRIQWHRAISVGLPYAGRLVDGTQLPVKGPDWVTWNPVTDSVPNAPRRLYGNERTIRAIVSVAAAYRAAHAQAPPVVVGDISRDSGGQMNEHVSHQNGLDVDVYYPRLDGMLRAPRVTGQIDRRLAQDLLDRFVAAGAQMVFVGYSTGLHGPAGVVVPYPSHENHMHVRFPSPGT